MLQDTDLKRLERNALRDIFQDGLADIYAGSALFFIGGALSTGRVTAFIPYIFIGPGLFAFLKYRLVYPRTGYVVLAPGDPQKMLRRALGLIASLVVVMVTVLLVSGDIVNAARWYRWMPIPFGLGGAVLLVAAALKSRLVRLYTYAVFSAVCGLAIPFFPLAGKLEALALHFTFLGLLMLVCGIIALVIFLRRNPVLATEGQDES